jgi:chloramphenicol O-acetyltransferase type A
MHREIDIEGWERKTTFEFFKDYEDPFFNLTANLDVTRLFYAAETANDIREFRLRILDEKVVEFDRIHVTQTFLNDDDTFSFSYFEMQPDVFEFDRKGRIARERYKRLKTFDVESDRIDLIYFSVIPWVSFTSFKHASRFDNRQTVPRMVFGKIFELADRKLMPFSVEVHHALVDGVHVGKLFNRLQEKFDSL